MKVNPYLAVLLWFLLPIVHARGAEMNNYRPPAGYVPDQKTAVRIAVAVWEPIYGKEQIATERPYTAVLKDGVWNVSGSLPPSMLGGTAFAAISKKDGTVLNVFHTQ
jgi:hypothetical protein